MTKIDIISGFLGAGKTTFIKKMLKEAFAKEQVVLIENEFGEIGIDGGFLKESGIEIREMNSGCICCSLVGDFGKSLIEVVETYHPHRILIEPSGVGKLSDVIKAVRDVESRLAARLNSYTTVVDATKCKLYRNNFGEFFSNQVEYAGAIILSRTDKAKPEKVEESLQIIRELNEKAPVITTPIAGLSGEKLLETMEQGRTLEEELLSEVNSIHQSGEHGHGGNCGCGSRNHQGKGKCCKGHHPAEAGAFAHGESSPCSTDTQSSPSPCSTHPQGKSGMCSAPHTHGESSMCSAPHTHGKSSLCSTDTQGEDNSAPPTHGEEAGSCGCGHQHHHGHHHDHGHHHAEEVFTSWGRETVKTYTKDQIEHILQTLESDTSLGDILRAKGMVPGEGDWIYFDMVPGEHEIRSGSPEYTGRICVIGSNLAEQELAELFGVK